MGDYVEESTQPLYTFGYGLSYTQFEYSDLVVEAMSSRALPSIDTLPPKVGRYDMDGRARGSMADTLCKVICTVKNTGPCDGDEVVQLYVRDEVATVAPASKLLKGFQRVYINKGESCQVTFYLTQRDLSVYSTEKGWHFEAGDFTVSVGGGDTKTTQNKTVFISL